MLEWPEIGKDKITEIMSWQPSQMEHENTDSVNTFPPKGHQEHAYINKVRLM